jgi:16S rRNA (cytosine1402-N4)-methyltransferase
MLPNVLQPGATDHVPVLAHEVRTLLAVQPGETVVDGTFGAGGHASLLAADLQGEGKFIAIDRDPGVEPYFESFRRRNGGLNARLLRGDFASVLEQLAENGRQADAILLDLGVSSMQIDRPERGFSYAADAPLDMRMDSTQELTARELVNEASERDLTQIFRRYGEERYAKQIVRAIARRRKERPFERTCDLVETIKAAIPAPARFGDGHPAKRVFQALRIAVNDELGELERALPAALEMLRPGGRLVVISFHSLEDRIAKRFLREAERGCICPPDFPDSV